jgi:hypothetical protein
MQSLKAAMQKGWTEAFIRHAGACFHPKPNFNTGPRTDSGPRTLQRHAAFCRSQPCGCYLRCAGKYNLLPRLRELRRLVSA